jgi:diguanylate cyclase (GGDEF)-like protein/PAS domain S-box-containing protein
MTVNLTDECNLLFEHLRDVVFFIRASDGQILSVNAAAEPLYGRSRAELESMLVYDLVDLPKGELPPDATRGGQISEEGVLFETRHFKRDGSPFPVEVSARLATLDGESTVICVVRDISDRVKSQRALTQAYDELTQVFNSAADGMRIVDRDFTVVRMNRTLAQMTGMESDAVLGYKCHETFSGANCHTDQCTLTRALRGDGPFTVETEKTSIHGESTTCIVHAEPFIVDGEIVGVIESFRDITERKRAEDLANYLATHDALTELPNRMLFTDRLEMELARARREGTQPALMFCDVDRFKEINDSLGHAAGDEVLRSVARSMIGAVREVDSVGRLGGDEFVVLLSDVKHPADAEAVARKILGVVHARTVLRNSKLTASLSIGIAMHEPHDDMDSLMKRADSAMYEVKSRGGDDYLIASG